MTKSMIDLDSIFGAIRGGQSARENAGRVITTKLPTSIEEFRAIKPLAALGTLSSVEEQVPLKLRVRRSIRRGSAKSV